MSDGAALLFLLYIPSDNILVLDIFFEALNYETIEQKKAYELAGLLGKDVRVTHTTTTTTRMTTYE